MPLGDRPRDRGRVVAGRCCGGHGGQGVGDVEAAGDRAAGRDLDPAGVAMRNREPDADRSMSQALQSARRSVGGQGLDRDAGGGREPASPLVVDVHQAASRASGGEERRLGGEVVLHVRVEVEVVAPEVEEDGDVEDDPVDAPHHQGMARHLHRAGLDAGVDHPPEEAVQVGRLRRGQRARDVLAEDPGADRADHGRRHPGARQPALEESGGRGLALGAGDADHPQPRGRLAVHQCGGSAEHRPDLGYDDAPGRRRRSAAAPSASVITATAPASRAWLQYVAPWPCEPGRAA